MYMMMMTLAVGEARPVPSAQEVWKTFAPGKTKPGLGIDGIIKSVQSKPSHDREREPVPVTNQDRCHFSVVV